MDFELVSNSLTFECRNPHLPQNVRVRHAKTGIYLKAEEGSFVNSNSFFAGGMVSLTRDRRLYNFVTIS